MARNKNRIYMAFYARTGKTGHIHHVALHVSPKNALADAHRTNTWRMHAVNKPDAAYVTQQVWMYDPETIISRPQGLIALVLLGKTVRSGEELRDVLKGVEVVQEDLSYTCKSWVFGAIELLVEHQLIDRPPITLDELYGAASELATTFKQISLKDRDNCAVPTCDNKGICSTVIKH